MEYFHAYVYLSSVPPPPAPAPSTRHAVRCHGTSLFRGYYELPRHLATPRIVSHRFTARHQLIPFWKWHFARKTGLINRIIAPLANVFIFFCSLFSLFLTRLLSFPFFELSFMIFDFCLSLTFSLAAFHLPFSKVNNTSQLFHSRYRFIGLSLYVFFELLCALFVLLVCLAPSSLSHLIFNFVPNSAYSLQHLFSFFFHVHMFR